MRTEQDKKQKHCNVDGCLHCNAPQPDGGGAVLAYWTRVIFGIPYDENKASVGDGQL